MKILATAYSCQKYCRRQERVQQYRVVLWTATSTQQSKNGAECARHYSKGKDEGGNCKKRMGRCADILFLVKAKRQHGRKQDTLCLNRAELIIEDLWYYLTNEWKQRFRKKERWAEWCCAEPKKQTRATHLFRIKGEIHIGSHSASRLLLSNTWGEFCVQ